MIKKKKSLDLIPTTYAATINALKERIRTAQIKASLGVNEKLLELYWDIGKTIVEKQREEGWGAKIIERMAKDLKASFPKMSGLSSRNLLYMKQFYEAYPNMAITQQAAAKIPWGHNMVLIDRLKNVKERNWYAHKTIENGWSREVLETWIDSDLHSRQGKAITNFHSTMPKPQSDLANEILKDPYHFDFFQTQEDADERAIEEGLVTHMQNLLTELGMGFAFIGRQFKVEVDGEEFLIDLLFYHYKLRRFIVVELKNTAFKPEYAGKMAFYLAAVNASLKHPDDEPAIGMILCRSGKRLVIEYALSESKKSIGVATYKTKVVESLPKKLMDSLPSVEQLEAELSTKKETIIFPVHKLKKGHSKKKSTR
ncbi:MAG: PDDEXK nuclease domain-containing protein [Rhabdochlamydiaceae bacterium]|jgi:predicted nuclease of restriction endonuclease-like (RecB) superfamily